MSKGFASNYRVLLLALGVFAAFACVAAKLVQLQVIDRPMMMQAVDKARGDGNAIRDPARRGDILDVNGVTLATSRSVITLGVDPSALLPADEPKWPRLAEMIGMKPDDLALIFNTKTRPLPAGDKDEGDKIIRWAKLADGVEESAYDQILKLGIKGVYGHRTYKRAYPHGSMAAHIIGYVNTEDPPVPVAGVEHYANFWLEGSDGWYESERDGLGNELPQFRTREVDATPGCTVVLSIDSVIQHIVEQEVDAVVKKFNPAKVSITVSDPGSGFILALANYPTFDLNNYNKLGKAQIGNMRNVAITDVYDPGSTFKTITVSAGLNEGVITPSTLFNCDLTSMDYKGQTRRFMPDDQHYNHLIPVSDVLRYSSNIGAAQIGMLLGEDRLYRYARAFGIAEKGGFPFGGEVSGFLNPPDKWHGADITRIPAGYSVSVTPIQMHYVMATIANGGVLMRPQLIRQIRKPTGEVVYNFTGSPRRQVITTRTAEQMAQMLQGVASEGGTAADANIPGYEVAGKTGTAQMLIDGKYSKRDYVGSFIGFFPASRPRLVISVIVSDAKLPGNRIAFGATVAAPSFKRIALQLIQYLNIKPVGASTNTGLLALNGGHP